MTGYHVFFSRGVIVHTPVWRYTSRWYRDLQGKLIIIWNEEV